MDLRYTGKSTRAITATYGYPPNHYLGMVGRVRGMLLFGNFDMHAMTLLNETGDMTIAWDDDDADAILPFIEKKMAEGYTFYLIKPRAIPMLPARHVRAKNIEDIIDAGAVLVKDDALQTLFGSGVAVPTSLKGDITPVKKAKAAKDVTKSQSVAVKPQRGG